MNVEQMQQEGTPEVAEDLYQHAQERLLCRKDPLYFAKNYVRTLDDEQGIVRPFPIYPFLVDLIDALQNGDRIHVEKSRQMLFSWTMMAVHALHGLHFHEGFSMFATSRKLKEVDDGGIKATTDSLFGKMRFAHERLPDWLVDKDAIQFATGKIVNDNNDASIVGESSDNAGRGGSYHTIFVDEFAWLPNQEHIHQTLGGCTYVLYVLASTPGLEDDVFATIAKDPQTYGFRKLTLHWTQHPDRWDGELTCGCYWRCSCGRKGTPTSEWYRKKREGFTDPEAADIELDIVYGGRKSQKIYGEFDNDTHVVPESELPGLSSFKDVVVGIDRQYVQPTSIVVVGRDTKERVWVLEQVWKAELKQQEVIDLLKDIRRRWGAKLVRHGRDEPELYDDLEEEGFQCEFINHEVDMGILEVKRRLKPGGDGQPMLMVSGECDPLIKEFRQYRWKTTKSGLVKNEPKDKNQYHALDSLRYAVWRIDELDEEEEEVWYSQWGEEVQPWDYEW